MQAGSSSWKAGLRKRQDNQARIGGKTVLSEISFVILSFGTKAHFSIDMIKGSKAPGQPTNDPANEETMTKTFHSTTTSESSYP